MTLNNSHGYIFVYNTVCDVYSFIVHYKTIALLFISMMCLLIFGLHDVQPYPSSLEFDVGSYAVVIYVDSSRKMSYCLYRHESQKAIHIQTL